MSDASKRRSSRVWLSTAWNSPISKSRLEIQSACVLAARFLSSAVVIAPMKLGASTRRARINWLREGSAASIFPHSGITRALKVRSLDLPYRFLSPGALRPRRGFAFLTLRRRTFSGAHSQFFGGLLVQHSRRREVIVFLKIPQRLLGFGVHSATKLARVMSFSSQSFLCPHDVIGGDDLVFRVRSWISLGERSR
jgi:hypothetical protein